MKWRGGLKKNSRSAWIQFKPPQFKKTDLHPWDLRSRYKKIHHLYTPSKWWVIPTLAKATLVKATLIKTTLLNATLLKATLLKAMLLKAPLCHRLRLKPACWQDVLDFYWTRSPLSASIWTVFIETWNYRISIKFILFKWIMFPCTWAGKS